MTVELELAGQTVVLIGGSAGIGLATARRARAAGAAVILIGRDPDRLATAAAEVGAHSTAAFDANDSDALAAFFNDLPGRIDHRIGIVSAATAVLPPFTAALALELSPVRVNLIAAGFVDTPLSAALLGDQLEHRRVELAHNLPIGRVVTADDVAALALHLMVNTALTGATYDIDGGQQFV
jgi:NAD(P)-dependent dehydrogenase (short-subunit alcohol dehydrogenase family)